MAGEPLYVTMPRIWGVRLVGRLSEWVSAKDVVLEMLRRHGVDGGVGRIIEYHGPGLETLTQQPAHFPAQFPRPFRHEAGLRLAAPPRPPRPRRSPARSPMRVVRHSPGSR
jgi:hypothetical protein